MNRRLYIYAAALALLAGWQSRALAQHLRYNAQSGEIESPTAGVNFYSPIITAAGSLYAADYYTSGYFRNLSGGTGLYSVPNGTHFYASAASEWNVGGPSSYPRLIFRSGYNSTILGYVYSDGTGFGFLNSSGNWMVYTGYGSDVAVFPGAIQIGSYGGITPPASSYGSMALSGVRGSYYGVQFGATAGQPMLMCRNDYGACGVYNYNNGGWHDYWVRSSAYHYVYGTTNFTAGVVSGGKNALTKVVTQIFCSHSWTCANPGCPAGSVTGTVSCSGQMCYQECCWGTN